MSEERLLFEARPGEAQQRSMTVYNPGPTALLLSCRPDASCATAAESAAEAEAAAALPIVLSSPRGGGASPSCFSWAGAPQGAVWVLPESEATLTFCFRAERAGSFLQSWLLHVAADAAEESAVARLCLVGHALAPPSAAGELGVARLEAQLQQQQAYSTCMDLLLTCVVAPATAGGGDGGAPSDAARASATAREQQWEERAVAFAAANAPLSLRFSRAGYGQLLALGARAGVAEAAWGGDVGRLMEAVAEAAAEMEEEAAEAIMAEAEALVHALAAPPSSALPPPAVSLARCSVSRVLLALVGEWRDRKLGLHLDAPAWTYQTAETAAALAAPPSLPYPAYPAPVPPPPDAGKSTGRKAPKVVAAATPAAARIPPTPPGPGVRFRGLTFRWSWECLAWRAQQPGGGPLVVLEKLVDGASTAWPAPPKPSVPGGTGSTPPKKGKAKPAKGGSAPEALSWEGAWGLPVLYERLPTSCAAADGPPPPSAAPKEPSSPSSTKSGEAGPGAEAEEAAAAVGLDEPPPADPALVIGEAFRALVLGLADEVSALFAEATP